MSDTNIVYIPIFKNCAWHCIMNIFKSFFNALYANN